MTTETKTSLRKQAVGMTHEQKFELVISELDDVIARVKKLQLDIEEDFYR